MQNLVWQFNQNAGIPTVQNIADRLSALEKTNPELFTDLRDGHLVIASDYSGDHNDSRYSTHSYLVTTAEEIGKWDTLYREPLRKSGFGWERRFAYKALSSQMKGDKLKVEFFPKFMDCANSLRGMLFTFSISREIHNLGSIDPIDPTIEQFNTFKGFTRSTVEKMIQRYHLCALLVAGLTHEGQEVTWLSDQDEIFAKPETTKFVFFQWHHFCKQYTNHTVKLSEIKTTKLEGTEPTPKLLLEDLCSIPDLAAGGLCEISRTPFRTIGKQPLSIKDKQIACWLAPYPASLKKLTCHISKVDNQVQVAMVRVGCASGSNDLLKPFYNETNPKRV